MELVIYRLSLAFTGLMNLGLAAWLLLRSDPYRAYPDYMRTRRCVAVWMVAFSVGYMIHALFLLRFSWPSAGAALTGTYFHLGAICFSWGFTPLLHHNYLTLRVKIRDSIYYVLSVGIYWTVAFLKHDAPLLSAFSLLPFFLYGLYITIVFYRIYNLVSERKIKMQTGTLSGFIRWLQMCCDLIVLFGLGSVAMTGIFPLAIWPYTVLLWVGMAIYITITLSVDRYGKEIIQNTQL